MGPTSPPSILQTSTPMPENTNLLPQNKHDIAAIQHLSTLSPSLWTPLIMFTNDENPHADQLQCGPPIDASDGLLSWLQDMNWPVAVPTRDLLLTLVNVPERRETHGMVLVGAIKALLVGSEDWTWVWWVVANVVGEMEDEEWTRGVFGDDLRALWGRVPREEEVGWGFKEVLEECLGEMLEDRFGAVGRDDVGL